MQPIIQHRPDSAWLIDRRFRASKEHTHGQNGIIKLEKGKIAKVKTRGNDFRMNCGVHFVHVIEGLSDWFTRLEIMYFRFPGRTLLHWIYLRGFLTLPRCHFEICRLLEKSIYGYSCSQFGIHRVSVRKHWIRGIALWNLPTNRNGWPASGKSNASKRARQKCLNFMKTSIWISIEADSEECRNKTAQLSSLRKDLRNPL